MSTTPDPRPAVVHLDRAPMITGARCTVCGHPALWSSPRCSRCGERVEPATFGPGGTVWSSTVVRVAVPGRTPPYGLAYVDVDDGPRILAHVADARRADGDPIERIAPGTRVVLAGVTELGDVLVDVPVDATEGGPR